MVWPSVLGQFFNKNDYTIQDCPDCRWCRVRFTYAIGALDWSTYVSPLFTTLFYCWSGHRCPGSSIRIWFYHSGISWLPLVQSMQDLCLQCYSAVWSGHWCLGSFISIWLHHPGISWLPLVQSMQDLCFTRLFCCMVRPSVPGQFHIRIWLHHSGIFWLPLVQSGIHICHWCAWLISGYKKFCLQCYSAVWSGH